MGDRYSEEATFAESLDMRLVSSEHLATFCTSVASGAIEPFFDSYSSGKGVGGLDLQQVVR